MSDLQPGRDLDAMVAEKVMGMVDNRPSGRSGEMWGIMDWFAPGEPAWAPNFPTYSTSISAAWEVVEKMRGDGWYVRITDTKSPLGHRWMVSFDTEEGLHPLYTAYSETVPHAICLAALRAVGAIP